MRRGEVWWAVLPKPAGRRPVVLVSRDEAYQVRELVIVAPVTTRVRDLPTEVPLGRAEGLPRRCVANADILTTIPKRTLVTRAGALSAEQVAQLERLSRLKRFFSRPVAEAIVAGGEELLEPHRREITAVFLDLRGFTAFTDRADPDEVMELLREYHATLGRTVDEFGGTLEHFAGDGVMIFFNDPIPVERPAVKAVRMAMDL